MLPRSLPNFLLTASPLLAGTVNFHKDQWELFLVLRQGPASSQPVWGCQEGGLVPLLPDASGDGTFGCGFMDG